MTSSSGGQRGLLQEGQQIGVFGLYEGFTSMARKGVSAAAASE